MELSDKMKDMMSSQYLELQKEQDELTMKLLRVEERKEVLATLSAIISKS